MKVILLHDVSKLGRRYETKPVSDGYARNFLIPRGLALMANPESVKRLEAQKSRETLESKSRQAEFERTLGQINKTRLVIKPRASAQGELYAALHPTDIVVFLASRNFNVRPENILLALPIKHVGEYPVRLHSGELEGAFTLVVEGEV